MTHEPAAAGLRDGSLSARQACPAYVGEPLDRAPPRDRRRARDLDQRGCRWNTDWHALMFTYGHTSTTTGMADAGTDIAEALRG